MKLTEHLIQMMIDLSNNNNNLQKNKSNNKNSKKINSNSNWILKIIIKQYQNQEDNYNHYLMYNKYKKLIVRDHKIIKFNKVEFMIPKVKHKLNLNFQNSSSNNKNIRNNIIKQMSLMEIKINRNSKLNILYK